MRKELGPADCGVQLRDTAESHTRRSSWKPSPWAARRCPRGLNTSCCTVGALVSACPRTPVFVPLRGHWGYWISPLQEISSC